VIVTIQTISQEFTKTGAEYQKVTGITGDGRPTTKSVFDNLKDKWELLKENATLDFTMVQKGQFWNVTDIKPIELSSPTEPGMLEEHERKRFVSPEERGMWWKEVGENFRAGLFKKDEGNGALLWRTYIAQMLSSLEITIERKEE